MRRSILVLALLLATGAHAQGIMLTTEKPGNPTPQLAQIVAGSDGVNLRAVSVDSSGRQVAVGAAGDGAAAAGNPVMVSGRGFNNTTLSPRFCDKAAAFVTLGTTATVQQIAAVATQNIYICGVVLFASTATAGVDLNFSEGTGSNCVTGNASIGGKFLTTPTAVPTSANFTFSPGPAVRFTQTAGDALCITQSATANATTLAGIIFYTQG